MKPDVVAYADPVLALNTKHGGSCTKQYGTSTATPVSLGLSALLASAVPEDERYRKVTPAAIKQVLLEGADRLRSHSMYVQGPGAANLQRSHELMQAYEPRVSAVPARLDLASEEEKDYFWPHSSQPLYAKAMPLMVNFTILNGMGVTGQFEEAPAWEPSNKLGEKLRLEFDYNPVLWPWSGYLGIYVHVLDSAADSSGVAEGKIVFTISSPPFPGERIDDRAQEVSIDVRVNVVPTPPRSQRVLWDDYHNLQFPDAFAPVDWMRANFLFQHDSLGDHPHTNYHNLFEELVGNGYFVEILSSSLTCFDASQYGTLVLCDTEMEFDKAEIEKLHSDVAEGGLGLVVLADWYSHNTAQSQRVHFFDSNTRGWLHPAAHGANVPALNRLLSSFGVAFSNWTVEGEVKLGEKGKSLSILTGTTIAQMPPESTLLGLDGISEDKPMVPVLALAQVMAGNVVVFSDSTTFELESYNQHSRESRRDKSYDKNVRGVFTDFVGYASEGKVPDWIGSGTYYKEAYECDFAQAGAMKHEWCKEPRPCMIPDASEGLSPEGESLEAAAAAPLQCLSNCPLSHHPGWEGDDSTPDFDTSHTGHFLIVLVCVALAATAYAKRSKRVKRFAKGRTQYSRAKQDV